MKPPRRHCWRNWASTRHAVFHLLPVQRSSLSSGSRAGRKGAAFSFLSFLCEKGFPAHPLSWSSCPTCLVWSMWIIQPGPLFLCTDRRLRQLPCCLPTACSIWTVLNAPLYPKLLSFKPSSIINVLLRNICFVFQPRTPVEASLMPTKIQLLACQLLRLFLFEVWVTRKGELKPV